MNALIQTQNTCISNCNCQISLRFNTSRAMVQGGMELSNPLWSKRKVTSICKKGKFFFAEKKNNFPRICTKVKRISSFLFYLSFTVYNLEGFVFSQVQRHSCPHNKDKRRERDLESRHQGNLEIKIKFLEAYKEK